MDKKKIDTENSKKLTIGIDAGGTKIRGVLMKNGEVLKKSEKLHDAQIITKEVFLSSLSSVIDEIWDKQTSKIGLGLPGPIENGRVQDGGRVKSLDEVDFEKIIEKKYKIKPIIANDAKVALRFEAKKYNKINSIFMITLGTGVGGGWFFNGKIMTGSFGSAYEVGQTIFNPNNPETFETKLSGRGFFRNLKTLPIESENAARAGSSYHKKIWQEFGTNLGLIIANISNLIEPELIILGGGIVHAWPLFIKTTKEIAKKHILSPTAKKKLLIAKAVDDRWAGAIGAAILAQESGK
ncbi:MAG: hypothetical protein A2418_02030 [Candidatus Brennerbacteria bacterium RIFOXYC1_FULL_41_11]|uniref:ROK family protein n=1 Tax=Candidatus Brennerbacteria bacterium RIFOXYD1_FULL_41_16 TaxID=1797529 RepID=A0A1G1XL96_9BACT|nr:MAG: hypothetical protein A2391_01385 [Candidatus Brennerbacteria bacterium RIFOXYB1_FULL_41_13]OGY39930.1 MAG: hypothetical protein A2418_02030 [Candidatus Brennerbacteria bacterium RIFOXYC1_FULL_41_11]OGY40741.1 MAG: hypothetical protein A2570_01245 [Candidatus Brennerbacteria bacterium RIFOXYD1_FULL_41_16]